jgi:hypothetical protein
MFRADVWNYIPNLLKVKPYDFFVGIGDINQPMKSNTTNNQPSKNLSSSIGLPETLEQQMALFSNEKVHPNIITILSEDHPIHLVEPADNPVIRPHLKDNDDDLHHLGIYLHIN